MDKQLSGFRMVGIGEVLWDLLPDGRQFGGSPVNVVYHCQAAGIPSTIVSSIGSDQDGRDILEQLDTKNISQKYIQKSKSYPTGKVTVKLNKGIPDFTIHPDVAWDKIGWKEELGILAQSAEAIAFGSLPQRDPVSRKTIYHFIELMSASSLKVFDINLRQSFYSFDILSQSLQLANILKINDDELPILAESLKYHGSEDFIIKQLMNDFKLDLLAYTKGANGSVIFAPDEKSEMLAPKVEIKDTVGAGDAFTGVLIAGLLQKKNIRNIHEEATNIAAWVCQNHGAMPDYLNKA